MFKLLQGDNRDVLKTIATNSIDAIVTDPPYGIDFLNKAWDANTGALETYQECLRVLKPGGHILAFSAPRTYHHLAITLEQAGFEIRDQLMWITSSGFPKSQDIGKQIHKKNNKTPTKQYFTDDEVERVSNINPNIRSKSGDSLYEGGHQQVDPFMYKHKKTGQLYKKVPDISGDSYGSTFDGKSYKRVYEPVYNVDNEWSGWGSSLKPAHEPICMARKPLNQSIADNVIEFRTGAINIDGTRIPYESEEDKNSIDHKMPTTAWSGHTKQTDSYVSGEFVKVETNPIGRYPSNVIGEILDHQKYYFNPTKQEHESIVMARKPMDQSIADNVIEWGTGAINIDGTRIPSETRKVLANKPGQYQPTVDGYGTKATAANMEYCEYGDRYPSNVIGEIDGYQKYYYCPKVSKRERNMGGENNHPCLKPIELMKYLITLITPPNGIVLDPFNGSGSTGMAAVELGFEYIGIELDPEYIEIANNRITAWNKPTNTFNDLFSINNK